MEVYRGAVHIHTTYSDGSEAYGTIMSRASHLGLDFVVFTDHDTLGEGVSAEGWRHNAFAVIGGEVSPSRNHYLALGCSNLPRPEVGPEQYVPQVINQGALGFIAHPYDVSSRYLGLDSYAWDHWNVTEFGGLEVWNFFSQWVGRCQNLYRTIIGLASPGTYLTGPDPQTLACWDQVGLNRRVPGLAGVDAHGGRKWGGLPLILTNYSKQMATLHNYIQTPEPWSGSVDHDRRLILEALGEGRAYLVNNLIGTAFDFDFWGEARGARIPMGSEVFPNGGESGGPINLHAKTPKRAKIRLMYNGKEELATAASSLKYRAVRPGVYRVEVWTGWGWKKPWIFSNPIYLR